MYTGKMTDELKKLFNKYYNMFNCCPDEYDDIDYFEDDYEKFLKDIKTCLKQKKEIEDI